MRTTVLTTVICSLWGTWMLVGCGGDTSSPEATPPTETPNSTTPPESVKPESSAVTPAETPTETSAAETAVEPASAGLDLKYITDDFSSAFILHPARVLSSPLVQGLNDAGVPIFENLDQIAEESGLDPRMIAQVIVLGDEESAMAAASQAPGIMGFGVPVPFDPVAPPLEGPGPFEDKPEEGPALPKQGAVSPTDAEFETVNFQPPGFGEADGPGGPPPTEMGPPPLPTVIVRFIQHVDPATFFEDKPIPPLEDAEIDGLTVKKVPMPGLDVVVHFADEKTVIITKSKLLKKMTEADGADTELGAALSQVDPENDIILLFDLKPLRPLLQEAEGMLSTLTPPQFNPMTSLLPKTELLQITAGISGSDLLAISLIADSGDSVTAANNLLTELIAAGQQQYETQKTMLLQQGTPLGEEANSVIAEMAGEIVAGIRNSADGTRLTVSIPKPKNLNQLPELVKPAIASAQKAALRAEKTNDLKQIGLGFHNYHDVNRHFPAAGGDGGENTGLSWRVHLLPYLGYAILYEQFHLDEPWDSEHNKTLIEQMPDIFKTEEVKESGKTAFHVIVGDKTGFLMERGLSIRDFLDGTSNTLLAVEAGTDKADIWTKPGGLEFDEKDPVSLLGTPYDYGFLILRCDGSVFRRPKDQLDAEYLKAIMTRNGGEVVE